MNEDIWNREEQEELPDEDYFYCDSCYWEGRDIYIERSSFGDVLVRCPECGSWLTI